MRDLNDKGIPMAKERISRWSRYLFILAALLFMITAGQTSKAPADGASSTARVNESFCGTRLAKNYLRPLARMTRIRRAPSSGKIPFGPPGLNLEAIGGALIVGGGLAGFGFSDDAVERVRRLNWDVSARLVRVNARGEEVEALDSKRRRIGTVEGNAIKDLLFRVPGRPAFYRVDIVLRRLGSQTILGEFSNYLRVVRPRFDARLLVSQSAVDRGGVVSARLANFGTETLSSISPDWQFSVQRFDGEKWVAAASDPPTERHKPMVQKLLAGQMDSCVRLRIPSLEEPGRYRFSMVVNRNKEAESKNRAVTLTTEFIVDGGVLSKWSVPRRVLDIDR